MTQVAAWNDLDTQAVAISRALAMDAVQKANSGHPGIHLIPTNHEA